MNGLKNVSSPSELVFKMNNHRHTKEAFQMGFGKWLCVKNHENFIFSLKNLEKYVKELNF